MVKCQFDTCRTLLGKLQLVQQSKAQAMLYHKTCNSNLNACSSQPHANHECVEGHLQTWALGCNAVSHANASREQGALNVVSRLRHAKVWREHAQGKEERGHQASRNEGEHPAKCGLTEHLQHSDMLSDSRGSSTSPQSCSQIRSGWWDEASSARHSTTRSDPLRPDGA